jgi:hypothetical protein
MALLFIHSAALAEVLLFPPEPDVKFSLVVVPGDAQEMRSILMNFAHKEKFNSYKNVPRAKGKLFFLDLNRGAIDIIAEQNSQATMDVDCWNISQSAADFDQITGRLEVLLRRRWPHLVTIYKTPLGK